MPTPPLRLPPMPPPPPSEALPARVADQVNSLQHFQQHSRLHFIGQWKTRMDDEFQEWFRDHPEWNHGRLTSQSLFIHIDMDAFFCSVQLAKKENEHLRTLPVGIAAGRFNSDISSCNYVARSFGITAGMYVNAAREQCPDLVILGYDLPTCEQVSKTLYRILFESFTATHPPVSISMEVYSIDEVMIAADTTDYEQLQGICERVRAELERCTGCTASCGIGPNIMLARLATQKAKPNGTCVITRERVPEVMQRLPFREIHGAGRSTREKVRQLLLRNGVFGTPSQSGGGSATKAAGSDKADAEQPAVRSAPSSGGEEDEEEGEGGPRGSSTAVLLCSHVQRLKREELQATLGKKAGEIFYHLCRGEDFRVTRRTGDPDDQRALGRTLPSSVGCSMNYAVRPRTVEDIWSIARQLLDDVCVKLRRADAVATGLRVTLLERHPYHPKETQKFMGRGRCVEAHVPVRFVHPLPAEAAPLMLEGVKAAIGPLLVSSRQLNDEERAAQLGLQGRALDSQIIWTVTLANLENVLIDDVRGMTVQATGLRPRMQGPDADTAATARARARERGNGQLSLAAAFSHAMKRPAAAAAAAAKAEIEVLTPVEVLSPPVRVLRTEGAGAASAASVTAIVTRDDAEVVEDLMSGHSTDGLSLRTASAHHQGSSVAATAPPETMPLLDLCRLPWGEPFCTAWCRGCARACDERDIPLVRAYLRAALLTLSSWDPPASTARATEIGGEATAADEELSKLVRFVEDHLGGTSVSFL